MSNQTPCRTCVRVHKDKKNCSVICKRLVAFVNGEDWQTEDIPTPEELGESQAKTQEGSASEPAAAKKTDSRKTCLQKKAKTCEVPGCNRSHKSRGLCGPCYDKWRQGRLPNWPPYNLIEPQKGRRRKSKVKKEIPRQKPSRAIETLPESQLIIDLARYPRLRDIIFSTANKLYVTPEHVIISLAGEAISNREKARSC